VSFVERKPVPDPNITVGPYRVLTRTDGKWALYDERLPFGSRTAAVRASKDAIVAQAQRLVELGSPLVIVDERAHVTSDEREQPRDRRPLAAGDRKRARAGSRTRAALPVRNTH